MKKILILVLCLCCCLCCFSPVAFAADTGREVSLDLYSHSGEILLEHYIVYVDDSGILELHITESGFYGDSIEFICSYQVSVYSGFASTPGGELDYPVGDIVSLSYADVDSISLYLWEPEPTDDSEVFGSWWDKLFGGVLKFLDKFSDFMDGFSLTDAIAEVIDTVGVLLGEVYACIALMPPELSAFADISVTIMIIFAILRLL